MKPTMSDTEPRREPQKLEVKFPKKIDSPPPEARTSYDHSADIVAYVSDNYKKIGYTVLHVDTESSFNGESFDLILQLLLTDDETGKICLTTLLSEYDESILLEQPVPVDEFDSRFPTNIGDEEDGEYRPQLHLNKKEALAMMNDLKRNYVASRLTEDELGTLFEKKLRDK